MKLIFLGTRGCIEHRSRRHRRHTATMIVLRGRRVMIDCGADWRDRLAKLDPDAIFITHAHPDHAFGLERGAPCPVYATAESWETLVRYPIVDRRTVRHRRPIEISGLTFEAFAVVHSIRAPAVGFRITRGKAALFYVPDVIDIHDRDRALAGVQLFVGDGATLTRPIVRRRGDERIGHTTMRTQFRWCQDAGVPRVVFTHCGSGIVAGDERKAAARLRAMAQEHNLDARIAFDGMEVALL